MRYRTSGNGWIGLLHRSVSTTVRNHYQLPFPDEISEFLECCIILNSFKGGNNQLLVAMEQFYPQVTCQGLLQSDKESCGEIVSGIPKSYRPRRFGHLGDRTADYLLPYKLISRKK